MSKLPLSICVEYNLDMTQVKDCPEIYRLSDRANRMKRNIECFGCCASCFGNQTCRMVCKEVKEGHIKNIAELEDIG